MLKEPVIADDVFLAEGAVIKGDCVIGEKSSVWYHAVIRGDRAGITIKDMVNIQDQAVVHCSDGYPVSIGSGVSIGHGAIIHGCSIGDNTMIGMRAIVMDGAKIGDNCIIGAGTIVTQNVIIPDNSLVIGSPAKVVRTVTESEIASNKWNARLYYDESLEYKGIE